MTPNEPVKIPRSLLDTLPAWLPKERIPASSWAEKHFVLSSEYSAKTGPIRLEPGQKELFDSLSDARVTQTSLMAAVQMTKTLVLQVAAAYFICEDPGPIMFIGSKDDKAEEFSKDRFTPMCRDIGKLNALVLGPGDAKAKTKGTTFHRNFPGGRIDFKGAQTKANLVGTTSRIVLGDELDLWPKNIDKSGSALELIRSRLTRFETRKKLVVACSPTVRGESQIADEYDRSDQRKPYLGCHICGHMQIVRFATHVMFDSKAGSPEAVGKTAWIRCEKCEGKWTEADRRRAIRQTWEWRAHAPFTGHAGFWMSHLYSLLADHSLANLVKKFREVEKSPTDLQPFINERLAELWDSDGERPAHEKVQDKAEVFSVGNMATINENCIALFAGVDQQASRLEMQVLGFGIDHDDRLHTWVVDYIVIEFFENEGGGRIQTSHPMYWQELDRRLKTGYKHPSGIAVPIIAMCIDTSYNPEPVYAFCKAQQRPMVGPAGIEIQNIHTAIPIRGYDAENYSAVKRITEREVARQRKGVGQDLQIVTLGTGFLKTELYSQLNRTEDPQLVHIPKSYSEDYFRGLVAEKRLISKTNEIKWEKMFARNEPLDTWAYAKGGFYCFKADTYTPENWDLLRSKLGLPVRAPIPMATMRRVVPSDYLKD